MSYAKDHMELCIKLYQLSKWDGAEDNYEPKHSDPSNLQLEWWTDNHDHQHTPLDIPYPETPVYTADYLMWKLSKLEYQFDIKFGYSQPYNDYGVWDFELHGRGFYDEPDTATKTGFASDDITIALLMLCINLFEAKILK